MKLVFFSDDICERRIEVLEKFRGYFLSIEYTISIGDLVNTDGVIHAIAKESVLNKPDR
jgi:hypothetical protein